MDNTSQCQILYRSVSDGSHFMCCCSVGCALASFDYKIIAFDKS